MQLCSRHSVQDLRGRGHVELGQVGIEEKSDPKQCHRESPEIFRVMEARVKYGPDFEGSEGSPGFPSAISGWFGWSARSGVCRRPGGDKTVAGSIEGFDGLPWQHRKDSR